MGVRKMRNIHCVLTDENFQKVQELKKFYRMNNISELFNKLIEIHKTE